MTALGLAERKSGLVRFGAWAAVVAGFLRIASSFIPYEAGSAVLEALYGVIDLGLMFGLIAIYIASAEGIGFAGLAAFLVALAGLASIVGPAQRSGLDGSSFYGTFRDTRSSTSGSLFYMWGLSVQDLLMTAVPVRRP